VKRQGSKEAGAEFIGMKDLIRNARKASRFRWRSLHRGNGRSAEAGNAGPRADAQPRTGTVTDDTAKAVQEVSQPRRIQLDKNGNVAVPVGKFSLGRMRWWRMQMQ
jgi:large subunit ribosomal protein L1